MFASRIGLGPCQGREHRGLWCWLGGQLRDHGQGHWRLDCSRAQLVTGRYNRRNVTVSLLLVGAVLFCSKIEDFPWAGLCFETRFWVNSDAHPQPLARKEDPQLAMAQWLAAKQDLLSSRRCSPDTIVAACWC